MRVGCEHAYKHPAKDPTHTQCSPNSAHPHYHFYLSDPPFHPHICLQPTESGPITASMFSEAPASPASPRPRPGCHPPGNSHLQAESHQLCSRGTLPTSLQGGPTLSAQVNSIIGRSFHGKGQLRHEGHTPPGSQPPGLVPAKSVFVFPKGK